MVIALVTLIAHNTVLTQTWTSEYKVHYFKGHILVSFKTSHQVFILIQPAFFSMIE